MNRQQRNELRQAQQDLGCPGCKWSDAKAMDKGKPCCTKIGSRTTSMGKCLAREEIPKKEAKVYEEP